MPRAHIVSSKVVYDQDLCEINLHLRGDGEIGAICEHADRIGYLDLGNSNGGSLDEHELELKCALVENSKLRKEIEGLKERLERKLNFGEEFAVEMNNGKHVSLLVGECDAYVKKETALALVDELMSVCMTSQERAEFLRHSLHREIEINNASQLDRLNLSSRQTTEAIQSVLQSVSVVDEAP